jgi:tripartite motif-containing protein 71
MGTQPIYRYSHSIGLFSNMGGMGFCHPVDLALGHDGVMYVLSRGNYDTAVQWPGKRVTMCTLDEEYLGELSGGGTGDGQIMWPAGIALDRDGNVYVSDEALNRVSVFRKSGEFLGSWGSEGSGDGEFNRPAGMAFDQDDNLLVADGLNCRIQRYTRDGRYLGGWGRPGTSDGEFNVPWGITVDRAGNVYVGDWRNDRVQKFDADGRHLNTWGSSGRGDGEFRRPAGVTVDQDGDIYIADWGNERVQVLGPDGEFRAGLRGESGLSKWAKEWFAANPDEFNARLGADMEPPMDRLSSGSSRDRSASIEKLFWGPTSVRVDGRLRVYVVDSMRHRIQIYQKSGGE